MAKFGARALTKTRRLNSAMTVSVEGKPLPKGVYGLHMIPNQDSWTVIFSKTNTGWGSYSYDQKDDALRVDVKPRPLAETERGA